MKILGIIPARLASKRFPKKPLKEILGMPMIGHVYNRVKMCNDFQEIFVASCDKDINDYINSIGGNTILTSQKHKRPSDRAAEALQKIEDKLKTKFDIVVIISADEPMLTSQMIANVISPILVDDSINIATLMTEIKSMEDFKSENTIKVVVDINNNAIYFSREPIPSNKMGATGFPMLKQIGIYTFRREFLLEFNSTPQTPLEIVESIDMMRIIENGMKVRMVFSEKITYSVDIPENLAKVKKLMLDDYYTKKYLTSLN